MKKGDLVYVVFNDSRIQPLEVTITLVGSKYITVNNINHGSARFHKDTLCSADNASGFNIHAKLYKSKEAYEQYIIDRAHREEVYTKIIELLQNAKDFDIGILDELYIAIYNTIMSLIARRKHYKNNSL